MNYQVGQELTKDVFGNPIRVGDPVWTNEYYGQENRVRFSVVLGFTKDTKENFRTFHLYEEYDSKHRSSAVSWEPVYKCYLATQPLVSHPYKVPKYMNDYVRMTEVEREELLIKELKKQGEKSLRNFGLLEAVYD